MNWLIKKVTKLASENTLEILVVSLLLAVPLYPKFPFINVPGTYVSIRLEDFLLFVTFLSVLTFVIRKKTPFKAVEKGIGLYIVAGLLSVISSVFLTRTAIPSIALLHWLRRVEYFVPFFLGVAVLRRKAKKRLNFFVNALMVTVFISFLYGFGQRHWGLPVIVTQNLEYAKGIALRWIPGSHVNAAFAGHYDLATFLVLTLPIFVSLFFVIAKKRERIVLLLLFFACLWLLANAISRISIVSYLLSATFSLIFLKKYKAIPLVLLVSVIFFAFSSDLLVRYGRIFEVVRTKVSFDTVLNKEMAVLAAEENVPSQTEPLVEDRSTSIRLNVEWPRAIRAFLKNPLLGTGYSSITLATDNDLLRSLGETGLVGFLAFLLMFLRLFSELATASIERLKGIKKAFMAGYLGALPGVFLNAFFIDVFEASKFAIIFWLVSGLAIGLSRYEKN